MELEEKPKTSLLAFQLKVKNVSKRSDSLSLTVPEAFNIPQVRSRLVTLNTKIKSLDTYIHLEDIPQKKIITLISEINEEIKGVYNQMDEIVIKKAIPKEIGEEIKNTASEDFSFFERARSVGYDAWLDTSIRLAHVGSHVYQE